MRNLDLFFEEPRGVAETLVTFRSFLLNDVRKGKVDNLVQDVFEHCFPDYGADFDDYTVLYGVREGSLKSVAKLDLTDKLVLLVSSCQDEMNHRLQLAELAKRAGARKFCVFVHELHLSSEDLAKICATAALDHYVVADLPARGLIVFEECPKLACLFPHGRPAI